MYNTATTEKGHKLWLKKLVTNDCFAKDFTSTDLVWSFTSWTHNNCFTLPANNSTFWLVRYGLFMVTQKIHKKNFIGYQISQIIMASYVRQNIYISI